MGAQHTKDRVVSTPGTVGIGVSSGPLSVRGTKNKFQQQQQQQQQQVPVKAIFKDGKQTGSNIFTEHNGKCSFFSLLQLVRYFLVIYIHLPSKYKI